MKRMMFLFIVLCLQLVLHIGAIFVVDAATYPKIIATKDISVNNEDAENPIIAQADYIIGEISASRAKSEVSSSVTMECIREIGNYDGFAQVRGSADRKTTSGLTLSTKVLGENTVWLMDGSVAVPEYITLQQFKHYGKGKSGEVAFHHPDPKTGKPAILYTAAKKGGVVADTRPKVFGVHLPFPFTHPAQTLKLADSAEIEKTKEDPNGDGEYTKAEITGMFDPYAGAAGQSIHGNVDPAKANTDMKKDNAQQSNQQSQKTVAPDSPTTTPDSTTYHACGVHEDWQSGDHSLQASCSETDSHGQSCTVTNFYACQSHTHQYPALISGACGHSYTASSSYSHRLETCPTNSHGDSCTTGSYYACQSHTHSYPDPTPKLHACGIHTGLPSYSSSHRLYTHTCGHTFYKCQHIKEKHYKRRCTHKNSKGRGCRTYYFICNHPDGTPSHTHQYTRIRTLK